MYNSYTDDCEYIEEYDQMNYLNSKELLQEFNFLQHLKSRQNPVFFKGNSMIMPEPYSYLELNLLSFPNTLLNGYTKISNNCLFQIQNDFNGIFTKMSILKDKSYINIGGIVDKFKSEMMIIESF